MAAKQENFKVDKGNRDGHRRGLLGTGVKGLSKVLEESKWGADTARERYGKLDDRNGAEPPKDTSRPQFKIDQPARRGSGDTPEGWLTGKGGNGMGPNFAKSPPKFVK